MTTPDFVAIGHVAKDLDADGWRLGGTVTYAATQVARLGLRAAIVTRASADVDLERLLPGIRIHCVASETTTTFENRYQEGRRVQHVWSQAAPIHPEDVPQELRSARIVLLGPLLGEVAPAMTGLFAGSLVGCSVQGWLRDVGSDRLVRRRSWPEDASVGGANVVFVSEEDVEDDARALARWQREAGIVVVTEGKGGATVWTEGHQRRIAAFPHAEVDATGAGDVFAAAFLVAFAETGDVSAAARFADAAAGLSVEGVGTAKAPTWAEAQQVLTEHKEIVLA